MTSVRVSSVESKSSHPMAAALVDYAKSVSVEPEPEAVVDDQNFPGEGIHGNIDGKKVYIGNKRIASRAGRSSGAYQMNVIFFFFWFCLHANGSLLWFV